MADSQGPWFKLYHEWLSDPKVQMLSESDQRRHIVMMCLRCRGDDTTNVKLVACAMRLSEQETTETLERLKALGLLNERNEPPSWKVRQGPSDKQRKRKWRQEQKCETPLSRDCPVTVPGQERDCPVTVPGLSRPRPAPDADAETDAEKNKPATPPAGSSPVAITDKPKRARQPAPSGHNDAIDYWHKQFLAYTGAAATIDAKARGIIDGVLRIHGLEEFRRRVDNFQAHVAAGTFGADAFTLERFRARLDEWARPPGANGPREETTQEKLDREIANTARIYNLKPPTKEELEQRERAEDFLWGGAPKAGNA